MSEPLVLEHDPGWGCAICPLLAADDHDDEDPLLFCEAGAWHQADEYRDPACVAPSACPLRTGPVLIRTPESRDGE